HTYEDGWGAPTVTVKDTPSKRVARITGPAVPPAPQATWRATSWGDGVLMLDHFPPNTELSTSWSTKPGGARTATITTDADGHAEYGINLFHPHYNTGNY